MIPCAFCERPLTCDTCGAAYLPPDADAYAALSRPEEPVVCPACEAILRCHWCQTPYDGVTGSDGSSDAND